MRKELLSIDFMPIGTQVQITALHFGDESLPKIYIQSSLHADEMPGSVAAYHLHKKLRQLEQEGRLNAHIVLVPLCNPLGLGQMVDYMHIGRFHLPTAQNFNRLFTIPLRQAVLDELATHPIEFSANAQENTVKLRAVIGRVLANMLPSNSVHSMHLHLLRLSYDADIVLDLHCDNFSVVHMYTMPDTWTPFEPLARYLGSECQLVAVDSNASSFDEVLSGVWVALRQHYPDVAIEQALISCTVELRGEYQLSHELGLHDAEAIIQYLGNRGYIQLETVSTLPELINEPHPLSGLYYVQTPVSGVVIYKVREGEWVSAGQELADIIDPITLECTTVRSDFYGFVFATSGARVATADRKLMSISCPVSIGNDGLSP